MIVHNGNIVVNNGRWINCSQPYSIKRHVNILSTPGGTITADPVDGYDGYIVKLSHTDNPYYTFMNYNVSGARLYNDRYFRFEGSDVTVSGTWQFSTQWLCDHWVRITSTFGSSIWTNKNLEIDDGGTGIYKIHVIGRDGTDFGEQYYYTPEAAARIVNTIPGWHMPRSEGKYYDLDTWSQGRAFSPDIIKSNYGWYVQPNYYNGTSTDEGFNALPVGFIGNPGNFTGASTNALWWATDKYGDMSSYRYCAGLQYDKNSINDSGGSYVPMTTLARAASVRLVKDDSNPPVCV